MRLAGGTLRVGLFLDPNEKEDQLGIKGANLDRYSLCALLN